MAAKTAAASLKTSEPQSQLNARLFFFRFSKAAICGLLGKQHLASIRVQGEFKRAKLFRPNPDHAPLPSEKKAMGSLVYQARKFGLDASPLKSAAIPGEADARKAVAYEISNEALLRLHNIGCRNGEEARKLAQDFIVKVGEILTSGHSEK